MITVLRSIDCVTQVNSSVTGFEGDFEHLMLNNVFSLQVIVKPSKKQGTYANIMGNHPGYNHFKGFVIQQDADNQNVYTFGFGNGEKWLPNVRYKLPP